MSGLLAWLRRLPLLAAACSVGVCVVVGCAMAGPGRPAPEPSPAGHGHMTRPPSRPRPAAGTAAPVSAVPAVGGNPARLAAQLTGAERMLGAGEAGPAALARAALTVQLACLRLATHPGWATVVTAKIGPAQRAAAAADIAATADLVALTPPQRRPPHLRSSRPRSRRSCGLITRPRRPPPG